MEGYFVHPSSIVESGAVIGKGSHIWHFCHVMPRVIIGENCNFGQNTFIDNNVQIGNGVKVQNNVSIYNGVQVADNAFIGPSVVFTNVINPRSFIERKDEYRKTILGKGCSIGANATIICGVTIGQYSLVGAGAVVTRDIPDFALVTGNPARQKGWVSEAGHKLTFDEKLHAICPQTHNRYMLTNGTVSKV